jgi:hypothetical protein
MHAELAADIGVLHNRIRVVLRPPNSCPSNPQMTRMLSDSPSESAAAPSHRRPIPAGGGADGDSAADTQPPPAEGDAEGDTGGGGPDPDWRSRYPPGYVVGDVRPQGGRAAVLIRVSAEAPAGSYCLKLESATDSDGPLWAGEPVAAVYVAVTVQ